MSGYELGKLLGRLLNDLPSGSSRDRRIRSSCLTLEQQHNLMNAARVLADNVSEDEARAILQNKRNEELFGKAKMLTESIGAARALQESLGPFRVDDSKFTTDFRELDRQREEKDRKTLESVTRRNEYEESWEYKIKRAREDTGIGSFDTKGMSDEQIQTILISRQKAIDDYVE